MEILSSILIQDYFISKLFFFCFINECLFALTMAAESGSYSPVLDPAI